MSLPKIALQLFPPENQQGFTLLETVLYLGLFGLLVTNLFFLGYTALEQAAAVAHQVDNQASAEIVKERIGSIIAPALVVVPSPAQSSGHITIISDSQQTSRSLTLNDGRLELQESNSPPLPITPPNSIVNDFVAQQTQDHKLIIQFYLNGQNFTFSKQLFLSP